MSNGITFRPLSADDLPAAWQLTQALRWPHRLQDWQQMMEWTRLGGSSLGAFHDRRLIGTVLAWHWGERQASIGMMIISPGRQRQGLGRQLLEKLLQSLNGREVMLQATEAGMPLYRRLGFVELRRCAQYQGTLSVHTEATGWYRSASPPAGPAGEPDPCASVLDDGRAGCRIRPSGGDLPWSAQAAAADARHDRHYRAIHPDDFGPLFRLDAEARGLDRRWLLSSIWQSTAPSSGASMCANASTPVGAETQVLPGTKGPARASAPNGTGRTSTVDARMTNAVTGIVSDHRTAVLTGHDGQPLAYGVLRRFGRGWLIGPLVAADETQAVGLCRYLCRDLDGQFLRIDLAATPHPHGPLQHWLTAAGLTLLDRPMSMIRPGPAPRPYRHATPVLALISQATG